MSKVQRFLKRVSREEAGQSLILIVFAFVALLIILGLALDLGLLYIERIKLGRACDAAALAAAQELPFEDAAIQRAMQYMKENGYGPQVVTLEINPPPTTSPNYVETWNAQNGQGGAKVIGKIKIDVASYRTEEGGKKAVGTADRIQVSGKVWVDMNFMVFAGFRNAPVEARALAENVNKLDVVIVMDESGSMNDDTYCWNCYTEAVDADFPSGYREYLPYYSWICEDSTPLRDSGGYEMLVAEAEYFTYSTSLQPGEDAPNNYTRSLYKFPNTFWMLQRSEGSQASGYACRYNRRLECGAHLMHLPHRSDEDVPGHATVTDAAPRLDYQFDIPTAGTWYVWIRAQCGAYYSPGSGIVDSCITHWGLNGQWNPGSYPSTSTANFLDRSGNVERGTYDDNPAQDGFENGSDGNRWRWVRLGSVNLSRARHTINIWGGGSGFRLDKIVLSRNNEGPAKVKDYPDQAPEFIRNNTPDWNAVRGNLYQTYVADKRYGGPADTRGRTGQACHKCNPIYGQRLNWDLNASGRLGDGPGEVVEDLNRNGQIDPDEVCDNTQNDMFDDQEPLRSAQEAAKNFVKRLRAPFEQVGFVAYSTQVNQEDERELNCIEHPSRNGKQPAGQGIWDPITGPDNYWIWCYDERQGNDGYSAPISKRDPNVTHGSIIGAIEAMEADGLTNIADGMAKGLAILGSETGHYGRTNAIKVMILLTDGIANRYPGCSSSDCSTCKNNVACCQDSALWPGGASQDCVIYYAQQAELEGVVIYTIGLGAQADHSLMEAAATETHGAYYFAPSGDQLDGIFQEIADRIFLRLIE